MDLSLLAEPVVPLRFYQTTRKGSSDADAIADLAAAVKAVFQAYSTDAVVYTAS